MNSKLKTGLSIAGGLIIAGLLTMLIMRYTTKAHSPEDVATYEQNGIGLEVFYNRPYRKDREIFGKLVPYDEVWRTGANEATTFETSSDILVDGSLLKAGKYTLWSIPKQDSWKVIFNDQMYPWGIDMDKKAYRDPQFDALVLERPVEKSAEITEQFTISFEEAGDFISMELVWDQVKIEIPIKKEETPAGASTNTIISG
ncbi:Protein of unknown function (DUF2911) [Gramella sp. Hel_I_59]|uniref:DUF2911 domain-containing protein n=1 Tax=Gramella sp. Hel_I_59 TaxID=1249978 RepID=UPI00114F84A4|nr:DUF2911 domain-containing protein [Gramella sp. Hel_I_59]TQI71573.1 Protein of unknown function (DUF2911) [Gramella sp. Hel_I_59]